MRITIKRARLAFPNIDKPRAFSPEQDAKFGATLIIEKSNTEALSTIKEAMVEVAKEKLRGKLPPRDKRCLRDGEEKADLDGFGEGVCFLSASAYEDSRPVVIRRDKTPVVPGDADYPYAGCIVNAQVDIWAQDNQYGKRINAKLLAVQFWADGEPFASGVRANVDDFEDGDDDDDDLFE